MAEATRKKTHTAAQNNDNDNQDKPNKKTLSKVKESIAIAAASKTDGDKEEKNRRKFENLLKIHKQREQLLNIQEQKRRRREDTAAQGRRSKELKDGKTPLKQKVERLRKERKAVIDEYGDTGGTMKKKKRKKKKHNIPLPST